MSVCPAKTQISLGIHRDVIVVAVRLMDAHADLSLSWVHTHFVGFVMLRLKYLAYQVLSLFMIETGINSTPYTFECL